MYISHQSSSILANIVFLNYGSKMDALNCNCLAEKYIFRIKELNTYNIFHICVCILKFR